MKATPFLYFDERTMLFSSKEPPHARRRVRARVLPREGNELERWKRRRGPEKTRARARRKGRDVDPFVRKKISVWGEDISRFAVKSLRTRTKDATGRFDANGEGRAVEWECRARNKGSRRGVDDERVDASALLGRRRFQDNRSFVGLVVRSISRRV